MGTRDRATRQNFKTVLGKKIFITFATNAFPTNNFCVIYCVQLKMLKAKV